jgi:hypothetical protein
MHRSTVVVAPARAGGRGSAMVELCSDLYTIEYLRIASGVAGLVSIGLGFVGIKTFNTMLLDIHWISFGAVWHTCT